MVTFLLSTRVRIIVLSSRPPHLISDPACRSKNYRLCYLRLFRRYYCWQIYLGVLHSVVSQYLVFFCVEGYSLTGGRQLSALILLNVNMPPRDACMFLSSIGYCIQFLTFTLLVVCHRASSIFSNNYIEKFLAIAIVMQLLILFLKSATQDAIYTGLIGLFYGPVFAASLGMANDILPDEVHMVTMALM